MQDRRLQSHGIVTPKEGNKAKEMETRGKVKRAKGISNIKVQMERGKGGVERIVAVFILVKWGGGGWVNCEEHLLLSRGWSSVLSTYTG